jgi:hypothetical protein
MTTATKGWAIHGTPTFFHFHYIYWSPPSQNNNDSNRRAGVQSMLALLLFLLYCLTTHSSSRTTTTTLWTRLDSRHITILLPCTNHKMEALSSTWKEGMKKHHRNVGMVF